MIKKSKSKKRLTKYKKTLKKNIKKGGNIHLSSTIPFNPIEILEKQEAPTLVKDKITIPSMKFLLSPALSNKGVIEFDEPFDLILVGWWCPTGNKIFVIFSTIIGFLLLFGFGKYLYKLRQNRIIEAGIVKNNKEEQELEKKLNQLIELNLKKEASLKLELEHERDSQYETFPSTSNYITSWSIYLVVAVLAVLMVKSLGTTIVNDYIKKNKKPVTINGKVVQDKDRRVLYETPEFWESVRAIIWQVLEQGAGFLSFVFLAPLSEIVKNLITKQGQKYIDNPENHKFIHKKLDEFKDEIFNDEDDGEDDEMKQIIESNPELLENKEEMSRLRRKLELKKTQRKSLEQKSSQLLHPHKQNAGFWSYLNLTYFTAYNGIVKPPDIIRTLWQDKDIFYLNGKKIGWFDTWSKSLKVNKSSMTCVQRIRNIKKISIIDYDDTILSNYSLNENLKEIYNTKKLTSRPMKNVILNINGGELLIPVIITDSGLFLDGDTQQRSSIITNLEFPFKNYINKMPTIYQKITTLIPVKSIDDLNNYQEKEIKQQLNSKHRTNEELNYSAEKNMSAIRKALNPIIKKVIL